MLLGCLLVGLLLAPSFTSGSGDGNVHLLEAEVAAALKTCATAPGMNPQSAPSRQKRQDAVSNPSIDNEVKTAGSLNGCYEHVRRNLSSEKSLDMLNDTGKYNGVYKNGGSYGINDTYGNSTAGGNAGSYGRNGGDSRLVNAVRPATKTRTKRHDPLTSKPGADDCLSQCVFANLQVVDSRGIPREPALWSIVQSSVTSQQARSALRDQLKACFQELESEAEDDGCSYSNKLERCLNLRLEDRLNTTAKPQ